jgi:putative tricarboxylic transport membrane protein
MGLNADRASGGFFLLFGLALYFLVIPDQVETVGGGNIAPSTLPNINSLIIAACGALLVLKPTAHQLRDPRQIALTGLYVAILAAGIYAMSWFGFEYVAPVLAAAIMWLIGERRPGWLVGGVVVMPLIIWFIVTYALGRALP